MSVSVHVCTSIGEYTRITIDKCLREQLCRCMCVVKVGGEWEHQWIKQGAKDEHLIGLGRIDG